MTPAEIGALLTATVAQLAACRAVVEAELSAALVDLPGCTACPRLDHVRALTPTEMVRLLGMTEAQLSAFSSLVHEVTAETRLGSTCPGCAVKALGTRIREHLDEVKAAKRSFRGEL